MLRKKTIELVQVVQSPKALIINGKEVSSYLAKILEERGCEVITLESYSSLSGRPALPAGRFDYIFLFDNQEVAAEIYEKNLNKNGKFILIETEEIPDFDDLGRRMDKNFQSRIKILKIGDPSFWSTPELAEKILQTLFSSPEAIVDHRRRPSVSPAKIKKIPHREVEIKSAIKPPLVERKQRFSVRKILAALFLIFFLTIFVLASLTFWYAGQLKKTFTELEYHLKSGNLDALATDIKTVKQKTKTIKKIYNFSTNIFFPFKNSSFFQDVGVILDTSENVMAESENFIQVLAAAIQRSAGFTAVSGLNSEKLKSLEKSSADIAFSLVEAQKKLDKVNLPYFPKEKINTLLSPLISQLSGAYEIISPVEKIFFQEGTRVYLVLFQNNMELRPTGGFIGSFGLLTVDNGKIADFKIQDVYEADGQLKGHVDPPAPIRKYLGQPHFFLRDSNFDPDFAASAVQASFFLQKELGKNVDGVIGVNLTLAQKLMQVVGPIKLTDFGNEEIESSNFFFKVHYFSQSNFFPGSTQKKDILTAVANEIMLRLTSDTKINYLELLSLLRRSLEEKNILFYFADENLQKVVEEGGWAGRMTEVACVQRRDEKNQKAAASYACLSDYLSIIEANLGVNKANYSVGKSIVVEKKIANDGKINTTITVSYENEENTILNQKDTYVNYLRFFVPVGAKLINLTLNSALINPADIDTQNYADDKTVFGFLVKIAPGNKGVVKITYTLPRSFSGDLGSYQLFYQKQAGDKNSPLIFSLSYPAEYKLTPVNFASVTQRENEVFYTTDTSVDRVFVVKKE